MAVGNEFRWEGRTAGKGKGNTLSDLGIDRCSVGLFARPAFRPFVCALPSKDWAEAAACLLAFPLLPREGRGKGEKVKAGAGGGPRRGNRTMCQSSHLRSSAPTVILACKILGHGHVGR